MNNFSTDVLFRKYKNVADMARLCNEQINNS